MTTFSLIPNFPNTFTTNIQTLATIKLYKRVQLLLSEDANNEDVELYIPPEFTAFWDYRGQELRITDSAGNVLPFDIYSETANEMSIVVHNVTGSANDVFYLYFDDQQPRDTSNLDATLQRPNLSKQFLLNLSINKYYAIYDAIITNVNNLIKDISQITVVDDYTNQVLPYRVLETYTDANGNIIAIHIQVKAPYILSKRRFYIYTRDTDNDSLVSLDAYIFPATSVKVSYEEKVASDFAINGYAFKVIDRSMDFGRAVGKYAIEDGETKAVPYLNTTKSFSVSVLLNTIDDYLKLEEFRKTRTLLVQYDNQIFYGTIEKCSIRKVIGFDSIYIADLTIVKVK